MAIPGLAIPGTAAAGDSAGLTGRAPEGDPVVLSGRTDRRTAPAARLAPAPVDPVLLAPAHAAGGDVAEPLLVRLEQPPGQLGQRAEVGHLARRLPRAEAPQEQHLGLVYVADAGQVLLVEQGLADG